MEHQTCTHEQPQMDVIVTDGGVVRWMTFLGLDIATSGAIESNPRRYRLASRS